MSATCLACFYCDAPLSARHEHDHWPTAKRHGGEDTVPICVNCHDLKDRTPMNNWPADLWAKAFADCGPLGRLLIAKSAAVLADFEVDREDMSNTVETWTKGYVVGLAEARQDGAA